MDVRERSSLLEEAARAQAVRQLLAIEAATVPHMADKDRREVTQRYMAMLKREGAKPMNQEDIWAANRAMIRQKLGGRRRRV